MSFQAKPDREASTECQCSSPHYLAYLFEKFSGHLHNQGKRRKAKTAHMDSFQGGEYKTKSSEKTGGVSLH